MRFLFIDEWQINGEIIALESDQVHRLRKVLRLRRDDELLVRLRGNGQAYEVRVLELASRKGQLKILSKGESCLESEARVHLGLSLLKKKKLELVIQKITELGVASFTPLTSQNCVATELSNNERIRLRQTAEEACQQSGRAHLPQVNEIQSMNEFISDRLSNGHLVYLFHQDKETIILKRDELKAAINEHVSLLIGPEGGFTDEEVEVALRMGARVRLLPGHILRAETAAIAAVALFTLVLP